MTMTYHKTAKVVPEMTPADRLRFWGKVDFRDLDGCWLWTGAVSGRGYGQFRIGGKYGRVVSAHRIAYALMYGSVPAHRVIDHNGPDGMGCVSQLCVRYDHLEAVGQDLNTARQYLRGERVLPPYLTPEERAYYDSTPDDMILAEATAYP